MVKEWEKLGLEEQVELYINVLQDSQPELQRTALESIMRVIQTAITSMTSIPKPLKFLRPHYATLKAYYETMTDLDLKKLLADILSVLAFTLSAEGERDSLKYRLLGSTVDIRSWGQAYVRNLCIEITEECVEPQLVNVRDDHVDLLKLLSQIVAFLLKENAEHEAVDLLIEVGNLNMLLEHVDSTNYEKTCLYLTSLARCLPELDRIKVIEVALAIYTEFREFTRALQMSLFLDSLKDRILQSVGNLFLKCDDRSQRMQFCSILARHGLDFEVVTGEHCNNDDERDLLQTIVNNYKLSDGYLTLARVMEVTEAKTPADVYESHLLDDRGRASASMDTELLNLAATFINAFVNAGFQEDGLGLINDSDLEKWIHKNNENGWISVMASLGMIYLWRFPKTVSILEYVYGDYDDYTVAGAILAVAIVKCGIKFLNDPGLEIKKIWGFVHAEVEISSKPPAIMGMGMYYAGTCNQEIREKLTRILQDENSPLDVIVFAAISLGLVFVGTCDSPVSKELVRVCKQRLAYPMWQDPLTRLLPLSLGLVYLGKQRSVVSYDRVSSSFDVKIRKYCDMTLDSCAYAGSGNVLKVQDFMGQCNRENEEDGDYMGPAVVGIAMLAMDENVGLEMSMRLLHNLLRYGGPNIRRAVPLAISLLYISDPKVHVIDTLTKLSRDEDLEVVMAAIISLGLIGAGTNHARIAGVLRNLSSFYCRNEVLIFCVRIAQGLLYMGKGLLTLSPYHSDRFLLCRTALAGLITFLHTCLNMRATILGTHNYLIYYLVLAMQPRMLMTVDESMTPLSVPVRVGRAVDVAGEPGRRRTITGFQTHSTPVLLGAGERAELATNEYESLSPFLEGFVILRRNSSHTGDI